MLTSLDKAVGVCDYLLSTIHGYAGTSTTFCVGTAAIVRHSALLSTQVSLYSAVGVGTFFFQLSRGLLTAGTCAALRVAARVYVRIFVFSTHVRTATARYRAFTIVRYLHYCRLDRPSIVR